MGEVWQARDPRLGATSRSKMSAQQFTERFEREARAIGPLNHTNICTLHDIGPNYLVMELVEGPTLGRTKAEKERMISGADESRRAGRGKNKKARFPFHYLISKSSAS